eukprot:8927398-Ditylum_brightwellii.AAC.1
MANNKAMHFPETLELLLDPNVWVANTGTSCDSTGHVHGLANKRVAPNEDDVTLPDSNKKVVTMIADLDMLVCDRTGNGLFKLSTKNIKYYKDNQYNLFSLIKRLKNRWLLHGNNDAIWITKGGHKVQFNICIETKEGIIFAAYMKMITMTEVENAGADTAVMRMNVNCAHKLLGHLDKDWTRCNAKHLGWEIIEHKKAKSPGEHIFLDIATIKGEKNRPKVNPKRNWRIMADERLTLQMYRSFQTKSGMVEPTLEQVGR